MSDRGDGMNGNEWGPIMEQLQDGRTITPEDFLIELRRIADALEVSAGKDKLCGAPHDTGKACVLDATHVGHHASADGRLRWLDES